MNERCHNPKMDKYEYYGGRGIAVCERWASFENFLADMSERPSPQHTLDRINVDGNYEPGNCRWATKLEQMNNRQINHRVTFNGETHTLAEWSRIVGIPKGTLYARAEKGWTVEMTLTTPLRDWGPGRPKP